MAPCRSSLPSLPALLACLAIAWPSAAQQGEDDPAAALRAEQVHYDRAADVVTASGAVELAWGGRVLRADRLVWDRPNDAVVASGHVVLVEASGEVLFTERAQLSGDLREGTVAAFHVLLADDARLAAASGRRSEGRFTEMTRALYSPCWLCPESPQRPPLWQIRARRVVHDNQERELVYRDAVMEFFGLPVAWMPWLAHPDPSVERRSGFLTPRYGSTTMLGQTLQIPYYFDLARHRDATLAPILTQERGVVLVGQYRQLGQSGGWQFDGSATAAQGDDRKDRGAAGRQLRWHIEGEGLWRWQRQAHYGFDLYRASDDTYLDRYGFDGADTLTSRLYAEGFRARSRASVEGYVFQGLRPGDDSGLIPVVAPLIDLDYASDPDRKGAFFTLDGNALALTRRDGRSSRRLSLEGAWRRPWLLPGGHLVAFRAALRGDGYHVDGASAADGRTRRPYATGRLRPQTSLTWSFPLLREGDGLQQSVEPVAMAAWSPRGGNSERIPNEDSHNFELDETDLFSENRFSGLDRVEGGLRIGYGLRLGLAGAGGHGDLVLGQVWRRRVDAAFDAKGGFAGRLSDYVGRLWVNPSPWLDLLYRFRLSREDLGFRRSELGVALGPGHTRFALDYIRLQDATGDVIDTDDAREQVAVRARLALAGAWTLSASWREDLGGGGTISYGGQLAWQNECFALGLSSERRFTRSLDRGPETILLLTLHFKTLGEPLSFSPATG